MEYSIIPEVRDGEDGGFQFWAHIVCSVSDEEKAALDAFPETRFKLLWNGGVLEPWFRIDGGYPFSSKSEQQRGIADLRTSMKLAENQIKELMRLHQESLVPPATIPEIDDEMWFRHTLLLASSGSGKSNTIRWRIEQLLPKIARGECSLILMEPQGDLTRDVLNLAQVYDMRERLIILDPADISVSVNIFEKPSSSSAAVITETIERIERVLATVVSALTPQQRVPFLFSLRALFEEEHPTMSQLMQILRLKEGQIPSGKLSPAVRDFFQYDFKASDARFIIVRLGMLLADPIFEALFGEKTTFDLPRELNNGRLIVINSSAAPTLYSKFWIEEIARCIQVRATSPNERKETFLIIDEAQQFIGENLHFVDILNRARGMRIGAFVAFQDMSAILDDQVRGALLTNTALKLTSRTISHITTLAKSMGKTAQEFITTLPEHQFAFFKSGMIEAIKVKFPEVNFHTLPRMTPAQYSDMLHQNRRRYSVPREEGVSTTKQPPNEMHVLAFINNVAINIKVDTGATDVVLSLADAAKAGIDIKKLSFTGAAGVVGGHVPCAITVLGTVRVDQIEVRNVRALVIDTPRSLLGQSFLNNLKSYHKEGDTFTMKGPSPRFDDTEGDVEPL